MPTYAYKCRECGNAFDVHQAFSDDALTVCPACGGVLRKVFGTVGVTFNGSGFYRTDSRAAAGNLGPAKHKDHKDKKEKKEPATAAASSSASGSGGSTSNNSSGGNSSSPSSSSSTSSSTS